MLASNLLDPEHLIKVFGLLGIFAIVFAESGLLIGFFLPGDSLLFTAGAISAGVFANTNGPLKGIEFNYFVVVLGVFIAAVAGDQAGYVFGLKVGPSLFRRPNSRFFKHEHLEKAQGFFDSHGPKAIILARFVPIVRTFITVMAGVGRMERARYLTYSGIGALLWATGVTLLGSALGRFDFVKHNIEFILLAIVAVSVVPVLIEVLRERARKAPSAQR